MKGVDVEDTPKEDLGFESKPVDENKVDEPQAEVTEVAEQPEPEGEPVEEAQSAEPVAEATTEPKQEEEEDESEFDYNQYAPQNLNLPNVEEQIANLPLDADGNIPASALAQLLADNQNAAIQAAVQLATAEVNAQAAAKTHEEKLWAKAEAEYPGIKDSPEIRRLVHNHRVGAIMEGGNKTPLQAAKEVFKHINVAKESGAKQASESVRIQESAYLESSSNHADARTSRRQSLVEKADSRNHVEARAAQEALLADWIKSGSLKIN